MTWLVSAGQWRPVGHLPGSGGPGLDAEGWKARVDYTPAMTKAQVQGVVVGLVVIVLVASALGYLLVPSAMLRIVGTQSNPQMDFLVRTLAAALLALSPGA
jgi:hypothetical protein